MAPRKVLLDGIALRHPITGIAGCCARAASGHAAAPAPLSSVAKNFRRSMWLAMATLRLGSFMQWRDYTTRSSRGASGPLPASAGGRGRGRCPPALGELAGTTAAGEVCARLICINDRGSHYSGKLGNV